MDWFRSWHGAPTDNKWLVIGKRANVAPGMVSAVAWALLDYASQNSDRGSVEGFDVETYAMFTGWDESQVEAVIDAMQSKGVITEDGRLAAWEKRQPKREDPDVADRVRKHREAKRNASVTRDNDVTDDVTRSNTLKRGVTQSNDRSDEIRLDQKREDEGLARPPSRVDSPMPENDPEFSAAISKLEQARIGSMTGTALLELSALWPDLTNGRRAWLDDAIRVAQASKAKSPVYAVRVLANALANNERPGQAPERKQTRGAPQERDLDAILGITS